MYLQNVYLSCAFWNISLLLIDIGRIYLLLCLSYTHGLVLMLLHIPEALLKDAEIY